MADVNTQESASDTAPVITVTDKARAQVVTLRDSEPDAESLALWLEVTGVAGTEFAYDLYFDALDKAAPGDAVQRHDDISVVIPAASIDQLRGATLGVSRDLLNPGMTVTNPNRPPQPASPVIDARPPADLSGDVAQRVAQVITTQINPSIASHGGQAELVAVEDGTAYLRLSGGCQGCGMATVTLTQGIEVAIKESVPEISQVTDVTDHASGNNPYYEAAKK
ncbi:MAG TPA: NifU family protein [Acidimicrobiales bacterium]|nr:NifU family protein [Acidimicrobiales bacterium]